MMSPSVTLEGSRRARRQSGEPIGRGTAKRAMHTMRIVIVAEFRQLSPQVNRVPEEHPIELFASNCPDQSFDERM